eukprot:3935360-Prymnesium_polylepis.1
MGPAAAALPVGRRGQGAHDVLLVSPRDDTAAAATVPPAARLKHRERARAPWVPAPPPEGTVCASLLTAAFSFCAAALSPPLPSPPPSAPPPCPYTAALRPAAIRAAVLPALAALRPADPETINTSLTNESAISGLSLSNADTRNMQRVPGSGGGSGDARLGATPPLAEEGGGPLHEGCSPPVGGANGDLELAPAVRA